MPKLCRSNLLINRAAGNQMAAMRVKSAGALGAGVLGKKSTTPVIFSILLVLSGTSAPGWPPKPRVWSGAGAWRSIGHNAGSCGNSTWRNIDGDNARSCGNSTWQHGTPNPW